MSDENKSSIPFSTYDFFGYIIPGSFLFLSICGIFAQDLITFIKENLLLSEFLNNQIKPDLLSMSLFLLVISAMVYYLGHLNSAVSHILIDRMFVKRVVGYPIQTMIFKTKLKETSKATNLYLIISLLIFCLSPLCKYIYDNHHQSWPYISFLKYTSWLAVFLFFSAIIYRTFELLFIIARSSESKFIKKIRKIIELSNRFHNCCKRFLHLCRHGYLLLMKFIWPIFVPIIVNAVSSEEKVDENLKTKFKENFKLVTGYEPKDSSEVFWVPYIYIIENMASHHKNLFNWLNLYGFLRNIAMSCFLISCIIAFKFHVYKYFNFVSPSIFILKFSFFVYIIGIFVLLRYWIIYKNYYSKYILRIFSMATIKKVDSTH